MPRKKGKKTKEPWLFSPTFFGDTLHPRKHQGLALRLPCHANQETKEFRAKAFFKKKHMQLIPISIFPRLIPPRPRS